MPLTPMPDLEPVAGAPDSAPMPVEERPHLSDVPPELLRSPGLPEQEPATPPPAAEHEEVEPPEDDDGDEEAASGPGDDRFKEERKRKRRAQAEVRKLRDQLRQQAEQMEQLRRNVDGLGQLEAQRALEAARAEITAAEQQHDSAFEVGDSKAAREAIERLNQARWRAAQIEQVARRAPAQEASPAPEADPVSILRDDWLERRSWFHEAPAGEQQQVARLSDLIAQEGIPPHSPQHFRELDRRLAQALPHRYARLSPGSAVTAGASRVGMTANGQAPGRIQLEAHHLDVMRQAGMDPGNPRHRQEYEAYLKQSRASRSR